MLYYAPSQPYPLCWAMFTDLLVPHRPLYQPTQTYPIVSRFNHGGKLSRCSHHEWFQLPQHYLVHSNMNTYTWPRAARIRLSLFWISSIRTCLPKLSIVQHGDKIPLICSWLTTTKSLSDDVRPNRLLLQRCKSSGGGHVLRARRPYCVWQQSHT